MARGILSRLKIMSGLDIAERRLPQDGKIKFRRLGVTPFEIRLATVPTSGDYFIVVDMLENGTTDPGYGTAELTLTCSP